MSFPLPLQPADRGRKWLPRVEVADRRNVKKLYNGVIGASSILCEPATPPLLPPSGFSSRPSPSLLTLTHPHRSAEIRGG